MVLLWSCCRMRFGGQSFRFCRRSQLSLDGLLKMFSNVKSENSSKLILLTPYSWRMHPKAADSKFPPDWLVSFLQIRAVRSTKRVRRCQASWSPKRMLLHRLWRHKEANWTTWNDSLVLHRSFVFGILGRCFFGCWSGEVKNPIQLLDMRWPWRVLNSSRAVVTLESRSADSIFQSHPVKNDDSEVFPPQPWRQNKTMRVL